MGITEQGLEFLVAARNAGVSFERTMTIGRQYLLVPPDRLVDMLDGIGGSGGEPFALPLDHDGFAEPVLERLGAREIRSLDASAFEGATDCHDLNTPLPAELSGRFSAVIDGGALEHVFDFPTAIRNTMELVGPGGHLLCVSPVNNAAGHGFYQFSPELYFRVLSPDNGFTLERMLLAEVRPRATWYRVVDPALCGGRVEFTTRRQAYLYVQSRRVQADPVLVRAPVQSDYAKEWRQSLGGESLSSAPSRDKARPRRLAERVKQVARRYHVVRVPVATARRAAGALRRRRQPLDPDAFQPLGRHLS